MNQNNHSVANSLIAKYLGETPESLSKMDKEFQEKKERQRVERPNTLDDQTYNLRDNYNNSIRRLHLDLRGFIKNWFKERKIYDIDMIDFSICGIQDLIDDDSCFSSGTDSRLTVNKYIGFDEHTVDYMKDNI